MGEERASITDVTECTADDLDNHDLDTDISSELTFSDDSDDDHPAASHVSGGLANSKKKVNAQHHLLNKCASPSPIESFARGAKLSKEISYFSHGQDHRQIRKETRYRATNVHSPDGSGVAHQEFSGHWYDQHCFDYYWRHYHFVSAWCHKHMEVYRSIVEEHARETMKLAAFRLDGQCSELPTKAKGYSDAYTSKKTYRNRRARRRRKLAKQRMRQSVAQAQLAASLSSGGSENSQGLDKEVQECMETSEDNEMDMEINDELLDFFAHTLKHRHERDSKKKEKTEKEDTHVNIDDVQGQRKPRTCEAPAEQPGAQRTTEILVLYGKGAPMIHGMETALQMNFDRNIDIWQPKLWPNMPFKVIFD